MGSAEWGMSVEASFVFASGVLLCSVFAFEVKLFLRLRNFRVSGERICSSCIPIKGMTCWVVAVAWKRLTRNSSGGPVWQIKRTFHSIAPCWRARICSHSSVTNRAMMVSMVSRWLVGYSSNCSAINSGGLVRAMTGSSVLPVSWSSRRWITSPNRIARSARERRWSWPIVSMPN